MSDFEFRDVITNNDEGYDNISKNNNNGSENIRTVAKFEKVTFEQFFDDMRSTGCLDVFLDPASGYVSDTSEAVGRVVELVEKIYDNIKIPCRATNKSAGYDFFLPFNYSIYSGIQSIVIPTGIRCNMQEDVALWLMPKSGLGFKYHMQLMNTIGLVDADYYNSDNEGHIMLKISTDDMQQSCGCHSSDDSSNKEKYVPEYLQEGKKIIQGVFLKYYTTSDDDQTDFQTRNGGFGSTGE